MDWKPTLLIFLAIYLIPTLLVWLFPKTWARPTAVCECKDQSLILRMDGSADALLMGALLVIAWMYFYENEPIVVLVPFLLFFKVVLWLVLRVRYEISAVGIRYQKYFSRGFMAWDDIVEINIVAPERRLMFRSDRAKVVISLFPNKHLQYAFDAPRVAQLIARFARKKLRHRTNILWCT